MPSQLDYERTHLPRRRRRSLLHISIEAAILLSVGFFFALKGMREIFIAHNDVGKIPLCISIPFAAMGAINLAQLILFRRKT
jgi:hypothetical protein